MGRIEKREHRRRARTASCLHRSDSIVISMKEVVVPAFKAQKPLPAYANRGFWSDHTIFPARGVPAARARAYRYVHAICTCVERESSRTAGTRSQRCDNIDHLATTTACRGLMERSTSDGVRIADSVKEGVSRAGNSAKFARQASGSSRTPTAPLREPVIIEN